MRRIVVSTLVGLAAATVSVTAHADTIYNTSLAPPGVYFGTGNANSGFTVDTGGNVEIGLSAVNRFIGPITPNGDVYDAYVGDSSHGGSLWGVEFSINLQYGGGDLTFNQVDAVLTVTDTGTGFTDTVANFYTLLVPNTCYGSGGVVASCTDASAQYSIQNAEPGSLLASLGDTGFNSATPATYNITLAVYDCAGAGCTTNLLASDAIEVNSVTEPGTLMLLGTALTGLGFVGWRSHARRLSGKVA